MCVVIKGFDWIAQYNESLIRIKSEMDILIEKTIDKYSPKLSDIVIVLTMQQTASYRCILDTLNKMFSNERRLVKKGEEIVSVLRSDTCDDYERAVWKSWLRGAIKDVEYGDIVPRVNTLTHRVNFHTDWMEDLLGEFKM